jgi:serine/threonine protein kinase
MKSIVGQTVSHYALLEKLGAGGMGEIYKARDSRLNRIVAVKVLAPGKTRDPERRRRFIQEAQAASALNHPNIITIHDILPEGETQYMVMEHVAGQTLHELISAGKLPVPQALQLAMQMANALAVAHAAGIIHRDFKPANVMVTGSGLVKILDFGLAKLTDPTARAVAGGTVQSADPVTLTAAPLTVEGSIMGTVNYMSPEQAEGLKVDARSDIFSFGAVLYEMLTGHRAFDGDSGISTLSAVLRDDVKPIREIAPDVPAQLDDIVTRCLRKNPGERWQSMTEVAAPLKSLQAKWESGAFESPGILTMTPAPAEPPVSALPEAVPASSATRKSRAPKVILLAAAGLVVLTVAALIAWRQMPPQRTIAKPLTPVAAAPAPTPQPAPPPAAAPPAEPAASPDATAKNEIAAAAPPPPVRSVLPASRPATPVPPPVVPETKAPTPAVVTPAADAVVTTRTPAPPEVVPVRLNNGVPFRIALLEDVPVDAEVGHILRFRVLDAVQSGDTVVIAKGSLVTGSLVTLGGKRNFFGERSKVMFRLISAESVDDTKINVRATPAAKADGVETRPFETPKGTKDKNLIAASGTEYVAYVAGDQTVSVHK